ncbi:MAG TPA: biotin--[acetyl-CoA-carboxylase] ligase [Candidatus Cloacimonadota bacterium]|nr:biotin--[acetyl-CoA-carboxylase] ligase [Candidatus Cloacimonadota bacterium]HQL14879.1 biotin--[acetyl-CoA-carboxylase] ligase [Candidatus Cloacimonadota bacterium]
MLREIINIPVCFCFHPTKTDSTMQDAKNIIDEVKVPCNFLCRADSQTCGRGRENNFWLSPEGGLWFTHVVKLTEFFPQLSLLPALCLLNILTDFYPDLCEKTKLKWPNDILYRGKKLAGILMETWKEYLLTGVGINTNNEITLSDAVWQPVSLKNILGFQVSNSALLSTFLKRYSQMLSQFEQEGLYPFLKALNANLYGRNKKFVLVRGNETYKGICRGFNEDGALIFEISSGENLSVYSGNLLPYV